MTLRSSLLSPAGVNRVSAWRRLALAAAFGATVALAHTAAPQAAIQLTLNENPYGPSPRALQAIEAMLPQLGRYTTPEAAAKLTAELAKREGVPAEQIVLGDLLAPLGFHLGVRGGKGAEFVYSIPGYPALVNAAQPVGGVVVGVPLDDKLENDLPALLRAITPKTQALFLINPHNPTGTVSDTEAFHRFLTEASRRTLVIVDEAYLDYMSDFAARTAVSHTRAGENVLVYRTFDKFHAMAGASLGYSIVPRELGEFLRARGLGSPRDLSPLAVAGATASVQDDVYAARLRTALDHELRLWNAFLDEHKIEHTLSAGNFVFFKAGKPQREVAAALAREGIAIGRDFPPLGDWTRITIGLPEENRAARAALSRFLSRSGTK